MKEVDTDAVLDAFRKNERTQEGPPDILCRVRRPRACPWGTPGDRGDGRRSACGDYAVRPAGDPAVFYFLSVLF